MITDHLNGLSRLRRPGAGVHRARVDRAPDLVGGGAPRSLRLPGRDGQPAGRHLPGRGLRATTSSPGRRGPHRLRAVRRRARSTTAARLVDGYNQMLNELVGTPVTAQTPRSAGDATAPRLVGDGRAGRHVVAAVAGGRRIGRRPPCGAAPAADEGRRLDDDGLRRRRHPDVPAADGARTSPSWPPLPDADDVNVVVLLDLPGAHRPGCPDGHAARGSDQFSTAKLLLLDGGRFNEIRDLGEISMGRPDVLASFIEEAADRFPAEQVRLHAASTTAAAARRLLRHRAARHRGSCPSRTSGPGMQAGHGSAPASTGST